MNFWKNAKQTRNKGEIEESKGLEKGHKGVMDGYRTLESLL